MQKKDEIRAHIHTWFSFHKQTQEIYTRNIKVVTDRQEQHGTWEDGECDGTRFFQGIS